MRGGSANSLLKIEWCVSEVSRKAIRAEVSSRTSVFAAINDFVDILARIGVAAFDESRVTHPRLVRFYGESVPYSATDEFGNGDVQAGRLLLGEFVIGFV